MAKVEIRQLRKSFGDATVIPRLDLTINDGELMVLVGPSGCGKSTVLRIVAGLETADSGEIHIGDRRVDDLEPRERDVAMVFQNYALYPHMTVAKNLGFPLRMAKTPRSEIGPRVERTAALLGLSEFLERKPRTLSGGQMQRVALGRAMIREPQVFLFDEPLSNLDAKLRLEMRAEIAKLHRKLGTTMIYVTHDQSEAMTLGDRITVMNEGEIQQVAPPLEVYDHPANEFVAGFIGSPPMNLLATEQGVIGIRPHNVILDDEGEVRASVDLVEPLGSEFHLHCSVVEGPYPAGASILAVAREPKNDLVRLRLPDDKVHRFDA